MQPYWKGLPVGSKFGTLVTKRKLIFMSYFIIVVNNLYYICCESEPVSTFVAKKFQSQVMLEEDVDSPSITKLACVHPPNNNHGCEPVLLVWAWQRMDAWPRV